MTGLCARDAGEADLERRAGAVHDLAASIPTATASDHGHGGERCARDAIARPSGAERVGGDGRCRRAARSSRRAAGSSSWRGPSARPAPAIGRQRRRRAAGDRDRASPIRPSAIAVVCCGVYQSDRGTLSMRRPPKDHAVTRRCSCRAGRERPAPRDGDRRSRRAPRRWPRARRAPPRARRDQRSVPPSGRRRNSAPIISRPARIALVFR